MHVLIVEDDLALGRALLQALQADGVSGEWLRRMTDAYRGVDPALFDCVLLDLSLPDGTGHKLLRSWRQARLAVPIIIITASSELDEKLAGFGGGADDFLVKPFAVQELIARIHAVVRRAARQASDRWVLGDLQIEPKAHRVYLGSEPVSLSPREFRLLLELSRDPGTVVCKNLLAQRLEPLGEPVDFAAIEVHVSNLRRRIGAQRIRTVRGIGYMLIP
jgi:two-component system response regulator BasR